ncbi:MAG: glutamine--fructose-6-phosphate transaminase (isomerizing) [Actinomycetia bacterium]|nr:glutamine--fructose-6-phosphate transaminase (isomerizing) [Actinomycetes bacterium]
MCGIVGYIGPRQAADVLLSGLARLEYRGYDSAGIVVNGEQPDLEVRKTEGKLANLRQLLADRPVQGKSGIGHTRWATHGPPNEVNAHPHLDCSGKIVVVHNGIIENFAQLRTQLVSSGHRFVSDTDSEVIAHLIEHYLHHVADQDRPSERDFLQAVTQTIMRLEGAYALAIMHRDFPDMLVAARKDSPLIIGHGVGENIIASDIPAVLEYTHEVVVLHDGELALVHADDLEVFNLSLERLEPELMDIEWDLADTEKGEYEDFMLKEIYEQPRALRDTLRGRMADDGTLQLSELAMSDDEIRELRHVYLIACGTSYHAGRIAKILIERWAQLSVDVVASSEFRYGSPLIDEHTLIVAITQSGETTDTMAGVTEAHLKRARVIGITNVLGSRITREADGILYTVAGPEIGVAATKTFTTQIAAVTVLALKLAQVRGTLPQAEIEALFAELSRVPDLVERVLADTDAIVAAAALFEGVDSSLFLGRGIGVPVAMEGALKLKEISYIHAEAYPAGEMKHGPIALITSRVPVVAVATSSATHEKVLSNVAETQARDARVLLVGTQGDQKLAALADHVIYVPEVSELLSPIVSVVPLQLLAYHVTKARGCNPDMPRNLAKSVTVE